MTSGNSAMQMRTGSGWTRGLSTMLRGELSGWFGTREWLSQILIWAGIVNGITLAAGVQMPKSQAGEVLMIFNIFLGMAPPVGVAILMMGAIVEEKRSGTAAWVLSKPLSRTAFVLSKLIGNSIGVLVCIILAQGLIGYAIMRGVLQLSVNPWNWMLGMCAHLANVLFYVALGAMLGVLFQHPGPVVGIPIAFNFVQQWLPGLLPVLKDRLPWYIGTPFGNGASPSVALAWMTGVRPQTLAPIAFALVASILFVAVAVWRFQKQEL